MIEPRRFIKSVSHALRGIKTVFNTEQSFRLQLIAGLMVLILSVWFRIKTTELIIVIMLIASVLIIELVNSIFERISDSFKPRIHPIIKDVKDIMAGAVLLVSIFSVVVGMLIFYPYFR